MEFDGAEYRVGQIDELVEIDKDGELIYGLFLSIKCFMFENFSAIYTRNCKLQCIDVALLD